MFKWLNKIDDDAVYLAKDKGRNRIEAVEYAN